jgi:hypothetical protein
MAFGVCAECGGVAKGGKHRSMHYLCTKCNSARVRMHRRRRRRELIEAFGGECVECGFDDERALQIDHLNGGGNQQRKGFSNASAYYRYVLSHQEEFQLLCANCNQIKRIELKEHAGLVS